MRNLIDSRNSVRRRDGAFSVGLVLGVLLGVGAGCRASDPTASRQTPNRAALQQAGLEWDRLFNARQSSQLAELYAEDALSMPFNRPNLQGRQVLQADFEKFFSENDHVRHETLVEEVLVADEWGIERARYTLTYTPRGGGKTVTEAGRHVMCRRWLDGRWQIVWEIFNTERADA